MNLLQTITLSLVQGITELLPVSSSGHLILFSKLLDINTISNFTLTSLHLGTTLAIVLFNWNFLFTKIHNKLKLYMYIVIATIPAAFVGVFLGDYIEVVFRSTSIISTVLILVGLLMIYTDIYIQRKKESSEVNLEEVSFKQTILAGLAQTLALIPGVSRSGITTLAGIYSGISQYTALRLSFILGIPILMGSFLYMMVKTDNSVSLLLETNSLISITITFIAGYISLWFLERLSKSRFLLYFGVYRIVVGLLILVVFV